MKVIEKEILKKVNIYVAKDGTEFENKEECAGYERALKKKKIKMLTENWLFDGSSLHKAGFDDAFYILVENQKDINTQ